MLSIQSSSLYRSKERQCGNSFAKKEEDPPTNLLNRPCSRSEITSFSTDGFLDTSDNTPTVASMAAIILSSSPDLASSFFHGYFRSDSLNPSITVRKANSSTTIKTVPEPSRRSPKPIARSASLSNISWKTSHDTTTNADVNNLERKETPLKSLLRRESVVSPETGKKIVKFADDNGLPLVVIKEFTQANYFDALREEIKLSSLRIDTPEASSSFVSSSFTSTTRYSPPPSPTSTRHRSSPPPSPQPKLVCDFSMPCYNYAAFRDKVQRNKVSLENVLISENRVAGCVRVVNEVFHKSVFVRYTTNNWMSTEEVPCRYVNNGNGNFYGGMPATDTFSFELVGRCPVEMADEIQFCIRFEAEGEHHWDNNDGANYRLVSAEFFDQRRKVREMEKNW